jgi:hypothetical protein
MEMGLLKNMEERRGRPARYLPTYEKSKAAELLPSVDDLEEAYAETYPTQEKSRSAR